MSAGGRGAVRRILIVNLTRFGDLLQTSPTVAALRERHPEAMITFLAEKNFADVVDGVPGIDHVERAELDHLGNLVLQGGTALLDGYRHVERMIAELRAAQFDLALNLSSSRMTAVFLGLLRVPDVRGWSMTADGFRVIRHPWARLFATMCLNRRFATFNLVDYYRAMAGGGGATRCLRYEIPPGAHARAAALLAGGGLRDGERLVALQLGASKAIRQWPAAAFTALAARLAHAGARVLLVGGGADRALAEALVTAVGPRVIDSCGRTTVAELAALLARADLLVSGDTGPMHMAVAVGTPVVGLFFGPASPFDTGPYGADNVALHAAVPCAPCDHNVTCLNPFCRDELRPETVAAIVAARLADDWERIAALARAAAPVRLYRTVFDRHGLYDCAALGGPPLRREDALRAAYRETFLAVLDGAGMPARPLSAATVDGEPFGALAGLARGAEATAARLAIEAAASAPDVPLLERLGRELDVCDQALVEHGGTHPDTAVLTQLFKFGKENLEGHDVATLARETRELYRALALEATLMTALLGAAVKEHDDDARPHQRA